MKLLMTNSVNEYMLAPCYARYLADKEDVILDFLYYVDEFEHYYQRGLLNKVIYKLYPKAILDTINKGIIKKIDSFKPDVIWLFKGMEVYPETLEYAQKQGIKLVNYNPDHPFIFESEGSGNTRVKDSIGLYDLHLSYSYEILEGLKKQFGITGKYLPFGFEISNNVYEEAAQVSELNKIAFVGYADANRKQVIDVLIDAGMEIDIYGPAWKRFITPTSRVRISDAVYRKDFWCTLRKYRVQLNIFRNQNFNSHNMRSFEVPGIGGIMLSPYSKEQVSFFEEDKEAFFYKNDKELIDKANYLLSLSAAEATAVREAARKRSIESDYSYKNRSDLALQYIRSIIN